MDGKYIVLSVCVAGIALIESVALYTGHDGAMLSTCVGAIAFIGGLAVGKKIEIPSQSQKNDTILLFDETIKEKKK